MKTIDFLPDRYRQATTRRRTSYWRLVVTLLFVAAFTATAYGLHYVGREVRIHHASTATQLSSAERRADDVKRRDAQLAELENRAQLAAFLRHPWPRSQIVAEILQPLPDGVSVDKLRIANVPRPRPAAGGESASSESGEAPPADASSDLARLRDEAEANDVTVSLEGSARDLPELHDYVQRLTTSKLIADAELTSIDAAVGSTSDATDDVNARRPAARFVIEVQIIPGWGLPGGPTMDSKQPTAEADRLQVSANGTGSIAP